MGKLGGIIMKKIYIVKIYEQPFVYEVEAESREEAEVLAVNKHNSADWDEISKVDVEVKEIVEEKGEK